MFKNNFKIAIRNILKHKGFSFINITGLAIGIACSILMFLFVRFELSYDTFHEKSDRIYRFAVRAMIGDTKINQTFSSSATFKKVLEDFPEVETGVKFLRQGQVPVTLEGKTFNENNIYAVDSTFFDVFTFPLIHGDAATALVEPNTMVVTEEMAVKYFGKTDVVGQLLEVRISANSDAVPFKITGVSENVPPNSHFKYNILLSTESFPSRINNTGWTSNNFISYYVLKPGVSYEGLNEKLKDFTRKYMGGDRFDEWVAQGNWWENFLQPLTSIHLTSDLNGEFETNGNETYVYMFLIISIIVLLIACINFMNLSTAKSSLRAREVGLRKVVGSDKQRLIRQFLSESVILSFIALAVGVLLVELLLPEYRNLIGRPVELNYFNNLIVIPALIVLGIFVGVVSGSYPAFILSSFNPVAVLKSKSGDKKSGSWIRNGLIVFQFSISIFLIVGTAVVYQQLQHMQNIKLGFEKEQVLVVRNPGSLGSAVNTFKEELRSIGGITSVSGSTGLPGRSFSNQGFGSVSVEANFTLNLYVCDHEYLNTLKLELAEGRFFSKEFASDSSAVILNKNAVELLGWDDPIGKTLSNSREDPERFTVIGVIDDYHYESLHQDIRPMALFLTGGIYNWSQSLISIRISTNNVSGIIGNIERIWDRVAPGMPFEYSFLEEDYNNLYVNEQQTSKLFTIFSFLAIFIACLGLFGLASFVAERKTKEIGIRKVLGATIPGIVCRLSLIFGKWVLLANIIAWPLAYYAMDGWLEDFAYRIDIGVGIFLLAGLVALIIALATVSYQSFKAAIANPVEAI